jgi:O-antigen/teichoic acid export membrane protein
VVVDGAGTPRPPAPARPAAAGKKDLGQVARGGFFNLAGSVVSAVVTMAFTVLITRTLDRTSAGIFFSLTSMYTLVFSVARLGVPTGLVYFLARFRAQEQTQRLLPITLAAMVPVVVLSSVLGVVGLVWAPEVAESLVHRHDDSTVLLVRLLSVFVLCGALNDLAVGATRGYGVMRPLVVVDRVARPLAQLVLIGVVVLVGQHSPTTVGFAWVLPYLPSALVLWYWSEKLRHRVLDRAERSAERPKQAARPPLLSRAESWTFWRFTLPRTIGSIAQMVLQRADVVLIGTLRSPAEAAVYAAATRFLVFGQLGGGAISTTIQPKISALMAKHDRQGTRLVYRTATVWLILITWPIYLLFCVFSTDLLALFGGSYQVGAPVIVLLSLAMLVATACGAVDVVLVMAGRSSWTMANSIVGLGVNLGLNFLLIPRYGIIGAAWAWVVAILINNLAPLAELAAWMRLHPFGRPTLIATTCAATCFMAIPLSVKVAFGTGLPGEVLAALLGSTVYLGCLWRWRRPLELGALLAIRRRGQTP